MEMPQELQRRPTLSHFMSRVESSNLRDLLKVHQDDAGAAARRRGAEATRTLATILACEKRDLANPSSSSSVASVTRTLLDIIRDEPEPTHRLLANGSAGIGGPGGNRGGGPVNWKALRDRLRLRRANDGLPASVIGEANQHREDEGGDGGSSQPISASGRPRPLTFILETSPANPPDAPAPDRPSTTTGTTGDDAASSSGPFQTEPRVSDAPPATSLNPPGPQPQPQPPAPQFRPQRPPPQDEPMRVSLMALLEQADRTGVVGGPSFAAAVVGLVHDGTGSEEEQRTERAGGEESLCCVCMVRNKGAAFIPCGHTFCRLCTRELWVNRGTCPLCNGFILEILDIF